MLVESAKLAEERTKGRNAMRAPHGLRPHREEHAFHNLFGQPVKKLDVITAAASYPKGATLFVEGQPPRGVFILCSGHAKLSTSSADGRTLTLRIAGAGEILGLPATMTGKPHELTANVLEPTQAKFIRRQDFLIFFHYHPGAALRVVQQLAETYHSALAEMRNVGFSHSVSEKLARVLLDLSASQDESKGETKIALPLTHEEIAQMIGSSRETVTRVFGEFKKKQLLQVKGRTLIVKDRAAIQSLLSSF